MTTMQTQLDDLENAFLEVFEPGFSKCSNASSFNKIKPRRRIITPRQRTIVLHGPPTNTMSQQLEDLENAFLEAIERRHVTSHLHSVNNEIKPVGSWWNPVRDTIDSWWSCVKVTVGSWWNNVRDIPVIEYTSIQPSRGDISFVLYDKSMEEKCILVDDASDASTDVGERSDEEEDEHKSTPTKISSRINTIVPAVTVMQSLTSWIGFGCEMFGWVVEC